MPILTRDWNHVVAGTAICLLGEDAPVGAVAVDAGRLAQLESDGYFVEPAKRGRAKAVEAAAEPAGEVVADGE